MQHANTSIDAEESNLRKFLRKRKIRIPFVIFFPLFPLRQKITPFFPLRQKSPVCFAYLIYFFCTFAFCLVVLVFLL